MSDRGVDLERNEKLAFFYKGDEVIDIHLTFLLKLIV